MADYTTAKPAEGSVQLPNAKDTSWTRVEPLISAAQLKRRYLFGIPLVSAMRNPITKQHDQLTDDDLKDIIVRMVSRIETKTGLHIFPVQYEEKLPYDKNDYDSFGYVKLSNRPVSDVESMIVAPGSNMDVFNVPLEWLETTNLQKGQLNLMPLAPAYTNGTYMAANPGGGNMFMNILGTKPWIPAYWKIKYTAGFPDACIPHVINEIVGMEAAMEALSILATTYGRVNSQSLGVDGLSQSVSGPGQELFGKRIEKLQTDQKALADRLKAIYGVRMFVGNV